MQQAEIIGEKKALEVNLDRRFFGTFAEIGAGQEVVRHFFQVGGAAGSIAKAISAYDMTFSDAIYGKSGRYVSKERLGAMLEHEYDLLVQRLSAKRGHETSFFAFADTVAARGFKGGTECHGWMGVRFQRDPLGPSSDVIIHVRMLDNSNVQQQEALGLVGVNLVHAALYCTDPMKDFVSALLDGLSKERIEVDIAELRGPAFADVDNRLLALQLVQRGLTNAAMFGPTGKTLQPSEVLYKKAVLIERGSFRPVTNLHVDMLDCAKAAFVANDVPKDIEYVVLAELTLANLSSAGEIDMRDFLARAEMLGALGLNVLISNYSQFHRLVGYLRRYTKQPICLAMGVNTLLELFNPKHYTDLEGGLLESLGRMFQHSVKLYTYPMTRESLTDYVKAAGTPHSDSELAGSTMFGAENVPVERNNKLLHFHLLIEDKIAPLAGYKKEYLTVNARDILKRIASGEQTWETVVPPAVVHLIKERKLLGYQGSDKGKETQVIETNGEITPFRGEEKQNGSAPSKTPEVSVEPSAVKH